MGEASGITLENILGFFEGGYLVVAKVFSLSVLRNGDLLEVLTLQKH